MHGNIYTEKKRYKINEENFTLFLYKKPEQFVQRQSEDNTRVKN